MGLLEEEDDLGSLIRNSYRELLKALESRTRFSFVGRV